MRALVVGLGSIGQRHARNLRTLLGGEVELLALRTRGRTEVIGERAVIDATTSIRDELGVRELTSIDDALAAKPDVAFICNPTRLHVPVAQRLADAGCHLFIEKPVGDSMDGVDELMATVARRGTVAAIGCQLRFHPCLRRLHALLAAGAVGTVTSVRIAKGEYLPGWHPYEDYRESYAARRALGGGVVLTLIHEIDYAYWLFGMPDRLFAVGGHLSDLEIDVEDTASILLQCRTGTRPLPVHVQVDFLQRPDARSCEVVGDRGKIRVDLVLNTVCAYDAEGVMRDELRVDVERNQLFLDELTHFLACVRGDERPLVPLADGIATLRIALAARTSMDTGTLVELG